MRSGVASTSVFPIRIPSPVRCEQCVGRVCEAVRNVPGVISAECDPRAATVTVVHDTAVVSKSQLEARIEQLVIEAPAGVEHVAYRVTGLD